MKGPLLLALLITLVVAAEARGQEATLRITVRHAGEPVGDASIIVNGINHSTDAAGVLVVTLPPGDVEVVVVKDTFGTAKAVLTLAGGQQQVLDVELESASFEETVTVSATRTDKRLDDQPMRVEVLAREEIEEKMLMTPGDIVMMLNETGGLRVQATSPALGAASVRIQGMRGRYTRFLADGLPLFGEVGGIGLLQIPPMDLGRVEVIKGVASSLYGAGAMGGVVNLLSRRPAAEPERELLINQSTRGATDAVAFYAAQLSPRWGVTLLGSGHWQRRVDVDEDAWSDLPEYARGVFRPRLFWDDGRGSSVFATAGATIENREGGTAPGVVLPQAGVPFSEALDTRRFDAGVVARTIRRGLVLTARGALARQRHAHRFGDAVERDRHNTTFAEVAVRGAVDRQTWVAGAAIEIDAYRPHDVGRFAYTHTIPGVFAQDDIEISSWLSLSVSGRVDHHSEYGTFFSPRIAGLLRSGQWASRLSVGTGFFGPSPLTEETEAAGLSRLNIPVALRAEEGRSASFDITRTHGPASLTLTVFGSQVRHPLRIVRQELFQLTNAPRPATNLGVEVLVVLRQEPFALTASYTFVRSREFDGGAMADAPLTPRHSAGAVAVWEREGAGRIGAELYFTGVQRLEADPYAERSEPYAVVGVLAERRLRAISLFINGENLTGVRQTRWNPLIRMDRAADGRWTVDAWAPLEGRNINGGIRVMF